MRESIYWCLKPLSKTNLYLPLLPISLLPGQKLSTQVLLVCLWIYCPIKLKYSSQFCLANSYSIFKHSSDFISSKKRFLCPVLRMPRALLNKWHWTRRLDFFFYLYHHLQSHLRSGITSYHIMYLKQPAWE